MAEFENSIGKSNEWYTPPEIFKALNCEFDLDPCSPGKGHWVPAKEIYTKEDDGLSKDWEHKFVFMNPPFGGRNGHIPWLEKFIENKNGIGVCRSYTSSAWFQKYIPLMDICLFPKGKTKFVRPDGTIGRAPGHGIVLVGIGQKAMYHIIHSNLGLITKFYRF